MAVNYEEKCFMEQAAGLVVMGRDSRSKVCGFESRHRILNGHFFRRTLIDRISS